ncbi:low molecular weight protein-tyrosine-phosphatase [Nocardioides sp.]|uniref:low molecular weight protein-tyrosine-phosphatase n=1 Tax=Nocardioides sp. TaxID=35761 RepID=UPI002733616B|nr:low molecular weight protein-tyrosine-phosphatase [Nocardioides sp.]
MTAELPPRRTDGPYRIALVCLGNICRSSVADVVLTTRLADAGLADLVSVDSAGTADWHRGKSMDPRAAESLRSAGLDPSAHRARHFDRTWAGRHDLVLAMDASNLADLRPLVDEHHRLRLFRDFDPLDPGSDVPDPYYGGEDGFAAVLAMVERTSAALVAALQQELVDA